MSDLQHPCEHWAEPISLAAAGCLSPDEERDVRRHIETCSECRERFRQLTELCGVLAEAQSPAESSEAAIVERVMSAVASGESGQPIVRTPAEMIHPTQVTRSLDTWRRIMRSPISRLSAAAVFVLAVIGVALWFHGGGARYVLADFIAPILEAKSVKFKITSEMKGPPAVTTTGEFMVLDATRSRQEMEMVMEMPDRSKTQKPHKSKMVMIFDWGRGKSLTLDPATKHAVVVSLANLTQEQVAQQDMFAWFRSILADARDKPDVKREPLGEKDIDGRRAVGFRVTSKGMVISLWGDPRTGLPVLAEATMSLFPKVKTTMSDFVFNVDLDESLFSVDPPAGYTVQNMEVDASTPEEKDLIETFRQYSQLSGGPFPDSLDLQAMMEMVGKKLAAEMLADEAAPEKKPTEEQVQKMGEVQLRLQRGLMFAQMILPPDADARYAGKGVSLGEADAPIFWYRPQNSQKFRIIYADLSVGEADTQPNVPDAQHVPASPAPQK